MFACYGVSHNFLFYTWQPDSVSDSVESLAVLKDCSTDLDIQIGKAGFKVDLLFPLE